jgi:hypothetical protein
VKLPAQHPGDAIVEQILATFTDAMLMSDVGERPWEVIAVGAHGALLVRDLPPVQDQHRRAERDEPTAR